MTAPYPPVLIDDGRTAFVMGEAEKLNQTINHLP
jgi:hypothetical protein